MHESYLTTMPTTPLPITADEFMFFRDFLRQHSGYVLQDDKRYLLESRLRRTLDGQQLGTVAELVAALRASAISATARAFIEAMTVNETMFFRDPTLFDHLAMQLVPQLVKTGRTEIRIWSAACSAGQEPYSIAMVMEEARARFPGLRYHILATDIHRSMVARAQEGVFTDFEMKRGLPEAFTMKYFERQQQRWQVKPLLRQHMEFQPMNLAAPWKPMGPFDIIFLRNILIYFDDALKQTILGRCHHALREGGYLALGASESIAALQQPFPRFAESSGFYRKAQEILPDAI
jgi:chemotaxis protein methyltransferase CheR